jgi:NAD(P)H-dependent flavin oxidoreductase YrpB (nitropropane dioxygenase family)
VRLLPRLPFLPQNSCTSSGKCSTRTGCRRASSGDGASKVTDPLHTVLCQLLGCRYPIIQTAMGWIAKPELVAAACNAGAFGFLACAVMRAQEIGIAIDRTRELTDRPFGVNFQMFQPDAREIVATLIARKVPAVSFGRAPDEKVIAGMKRAGIKCVPTVGALKHARKMAALGVDMLVVQGGEGRGHTGSVASTVLLPQVLDAVRIPVVAAGGFADGRGLAAALAFGAQGIAMGTRFLMTRESPVPAQTKLRYQAASTQDILVTDRLDGVPQRMIRNRVAARLEGAGRIRLAATAVGSALRLKKLTRATWSELVRSAREMHRAGNTTLAQALMAATAPILIRRAVEEGRPDEGIMATGLVAGRLEDLPACEELIQRIVREAYERLADLGVRVPVLRAMS